MAWIYAAAMEAFDTSTALPIVVVAKVIEVESVGYGADEMLIRQSVRAPLLATDIHNSVASGQKSAIPQPTSDRELNAVLPAVQNCIFHFSNRSAAWHAPQFTKVV